MFEYKVYEINGARSLHNMGPHCSTAMPRKGEMVNLYDKERSENYIYEVVQICHTTMDLPTESLLPTTYVGDIYVMKSRTPKEFISEIYDKTEDDLILRPNQITTFPQRVKPPKR